MQENKKKILESSIKFFSEKGIHQTTLADVAMDAGISKGTLFYYYKSKDELLYDILDIAIRELTELITKVIQESNGEVTKELFLLTFNTLLKYDFLMKINYYILQEALLEDEVFQDKFKLKYQDWRDDIALLFEKTRLKLPGTKRNARAAILLAALDGLCLQFLLDREALDLDSICCELADMFSYHLKA